MPHPEQRPPIPDWAARERASDLAWIAENLPEFWLAARTGYEAVGRGALVVDTTVRPTGGGHPFGYFSQQQIIESGDQDAARMVAAYDPSWELIATLIKQLERISTYRVGVPSQRPPR